MVDPVSWTKYYFYHDNLNAVLHKKTKFIDLGLMDYKQAWDYQTILFQSILDVKSANRTHNEQNLTHNYLLFCEHPHVYTLGKSGDEKKPADQKGRPPHH